MKRLMTWFLATKARFKWNGIAKLLSIKSGNHQSRRESWSIHTKCMFGLAFWSMGQQTLLFLLVAWTPSFTLKQCWQKLMLPFISSTFPNGHRFQQDNDPKHTSKLAKQFYQSNAVNWWPTPPESPDLNPIELVWYEVKHHLRTVVKPRTEEALINSITEFWDRAMTTEKCCKIILQTYMLHY